ncbi:mitochondrial import inner membrane translocase subunit Tim10 B-like [Prorops nasuta]|uniref:mitochondrial import inner membrane translocase subunit Tim10 B-like n=1 Tax=Prorops nasuta TaxID=863751 RepID=UPI0034CEC85F
MDSTFMQIRNFKDFLLLYNQITENCFRRCTNTFNTRDITEEEDLCVKNCANKHINANHKIMEIFTEVQPIMVQRRINDMNSTQAAVPKQESIEQQQVEVSSI